MPKILAVDARCAGIARRVGLIAGSVSDEDAKKIYPAGWKSPKPYLRIVKQPS